MSFTPWPHQVRGVADITNAIESGKKRMCYTSVTGSGKSWIICSVIEWAVERGMRVVLYSNRRLLTEQLMGQLQKDGISFGVRAAEYDEHVNDEAPVQICSIQTDQARIIGKRKKAKLLDNPAIARRQFPLFPADLVIADEIHLQCGPIAAAIFDEYCEMGAAIIGITATPLGVSHVCKELILGCNTSEGRRCGALLPARVFACPEIDTSKIERVKTSGGEFSLADIRKHCWSQAIYGHVHTHLLRNNPDMRPFLLFAPGVEESVGFDKHLNSMGIKTAHIDGEDCVVNGERYKSSRDVRKQIIADVKSGHIFGVTNRFVLREAVDIPELYMLILACPIGSLLSYVQIVGRVLRNHHTLDHTVINDHGGNYWRHGSPNADRDDIWLEFFNDPDGESLPTDERMENIRKEKEECPLCCPKCGSVQLMPKTGRCYNCSHDLRKKNGRVVIQRDGSLLEVTGLPVKPRREVKTKDMQEAWSRAYWASKRVGGKLYGHSFAQLRGMIASGHFSGFEKLRGQFPSEGLPFTPKSSVDWFRSTKDVPAMNLYQP